jgi:hypothetical protein
MGGASNNLMMPVSALYDSQNKPADEVGSEFPQQKENDQDN